MHLLGGDPTYKKKKQKLDLLLINFCFLFIFGVIIHVLPSLVEYVHVFVFFLCMCNLLYFRYNCLFLIKKTLARFFVLNPKCLILSFDLTIIDGNMCIIGFELVEFDEGIN
jgi:hypothetical protein